MKVHVQLPPTPLARVSYDAEQREVVIKPLFSGARDSYTLAWVTVEGAKGRQRLIALQLNAASGRLSARELIDVVPQFDLSCDDEPEPPENDELVETPLEDEA